MDRKARKTRNSASQGGAETTTVVPQVVPSGPVTSQQAAELLAIWDRLDEAKRDDLLAIARGLSR